MPRSHSLHRLSAEANEAPSAAIFSGGSAVNAIAWELSDALRESDYICTFFFFFFFFFFDACVRCSPSSVSPASCADLSR